jgi:Zn-dependent M28 family amino/carboxypeptidase
MPRRLPRHARLLVRLPTLVGILFGGAIFLFWWETIRMPGGSFRGPLPDPSAEELALSRVLERDVRFLSLDIGERNLEHAAALDATAFWIGEQLNAIPLAFRRTSFSARGHAAHNIEAVVPGSPVNAPIVVVGAHYDSALGTPGADDNATGVACLIELARRFRSSRAPRELRLVWFTNEEPPHFQTRDMGSLHYARALATEPRDVVAMLSLESLGHYSDSPGSQQYPGVVSAFFPSTGDFLAFVGNDDSVDLVRRAIAVFRRTTRFPSEGLALNGKLTGVGWSDHWSFWQIGVPAIMLTDTALFRSRHYHRVSDTPERLDYQRLARVTLGVEQVVRALLEPDD